MNSLSVELPPDFLAMAPPAAGPVVQTSPEIDDGDGWELIHCYSRAEALADGTLIDAGPMAREAGFKHPVALTAGAWADCVAWTRGPGLGQSIEGRLWDVLFMAHYAARRARTGAIEVPVVLERIPDTPNGGDEPKRARLTLHIGPGDSGEPVLTIMLPGED